MFRSFFISLSKIKWAQRMITSWKFARRASRRFVAGETLEEAITVVKSLNQAGILATLDFLGENTTSPEEAETSTHEILGVLQAITDNKVSSNVSVKLSQFGLTLDEQLCRQNLGMILEKARQNGNFVRIDMEDSSLTGKTLDQLRWALKQGYSNVGIVIQAYLLRSRKDLEDLRQVKAHVRLCKGAYQEPAEIAFPIKKDVDTNYDTLAAYLLETAKEANYPEESPDGLVPPIPAFATHDPARIERVIHLMMVNQVPKPAIEFQMLYGIRRDLQQKLVEEGYRVRVYVPFGSHWYPYFMRRLAERPANLWFFLTNFLRK